MRSVLALGGRTGSGGVAARASNGVGPAGQGGLTLRRSETRRETSLDVDHFRGVSAAREEACSDSSQHGGPPRRRLELARPFDRQVRDAALKFEQQIVG